MFLFGRLLVLFSYLQLSNSTGVLRLKFLTYNNPNSRLADGSCCEGAVCSNPCDNYFRICLTLPSGNNCGLGYKETSVLGDDSFDFGRSLGGGTRNPLVYHFFSWQGSFALSVEVRDKDDGIFGSDDHVDRVDKNWVLPAQQKESVATAKQTLLSGRVSLIKVEASVYCDDTFLLPSCREPCVYTDNEHGHFSCDYENGKKVCLDGWYGGGNCLKKRKYCVPRDDDGAHFKCDRVTGDIVCLPGWKNEKVNCTEEINECLADPCVRGNCTDLINDFNCICPVGYTGKRCQKDINECLSSPCKYGICNDLLNNYTCDCRAGFVGRHCEIELDECLSNPCQNGSCINAINAFKCQCNSGYSGKTCETDINECSSNPCKNNATCIDLIGAYSCTCASQFTGRHCETHIEATPTDKRSSIKTIPLYQEATHLPFTTSTRAGKLIATSSQPPASVLKSNYIESSAKETGASQATAPHFELHSITQKEQLGCSSVVQEGGRSTAKMEKVKFLIKLRGPTEKWNKANSVTCEREICVGIERNCARKHQIACEDSKSDMDKNETSAMEIIEISRNNSMVVAVKEFTLNETGNTDKQSKIMCIQRAILGASQEIEEKTSFKIVHVSWSTSGNQTVQPQTSFELSHATSSENLHPTEAPTDVEALLNRGRGKMLATIVVCHIVAITLVLVFIQWRRNQRSLKRVTPISTKHPLKSLQNSNSSNISSQRNSNSKKQGTKINDKSKLAYNEFGNSREKDRLTTSKLETIESAKSKAKPVGPRKRDTVSLIEYEANQLETVFL